METVWQLEVKLPVGVGIMGRVNELAFCPGGVMSGAEGQLSRAMLITEDTSTIRSLLTLLVLEAAAWLEWCETQVKPKTDSAATTVMVNSAVFAVFELGLILPKSNPHFYKCLG